MAAELEILEYEKNRLSTYPELLAGFEHISQSDVNAGYDIKSFDLEPGVKGFAKPRYIEVKAVSKLNFKFIWTRNEIDKSKVSGNQYYLYLLPVISDKKFDIAGLKIINNPYEKVFKNKNYWEKREEQYSIWIKKSK